jgi:hypothetical protein
MHRDEWDLDILGQGTKEDVMAGQRRQPVLLKATDEVRGENSDARAGYGMSCFCLA